MKRVIRIIGIVLGSLLGIVLLAGIVLYLFGDGHLKEEDFINTIQTGKTPGGHQLDPKFMPSQNYRKFYDDELKAIWVYLQSLPKLTQYTG